MNRRERVVLYLVLPLLTALNLCVLFGWLGRPAYAEPPASATDSNALHALTFLGDEPADNVVLHNHKGRLAWGDTAHERLHTVGYVYIGKILGELMQADSRREELNLLSEEMSEVESEYRRQLEDLYKRAQAIDPESEEGKQFDQQGRALLDEYRAWQQDALRRRGKLQAEQLEDAYRELVAAVDVVADRQGIDIVNHFIPAEEPFNASNPDQAMINIRMRTALKYPEQLDITEDVIEELALEIE